jgi:hypothetical protein
MNWRVIVFCGAFASSAFVGCIDLPIADSGDSRPYGGGGYGGYPDYDRGYQIEDERAWQREHRHYGCSEVEDRLRYDRSKLSAIDPSKHHKAAEWYRDDIADAERDLPECRREHRRDDRRGEDRWRHEEPAHSDPEANRRADCAKLRNRVATDRAKLAEIDPSKHHKAAQYYQDDLREAERGLSGCR